MEAHTTNGGTPTRQYSVMDWRSFKTEFYIHMHLWSIGNPVIYSGMRSLLSIWRFVRHLLMRLLTALHCSRGKAAPSKAGKRHAERCRPRTWRRGWCGVHVRGRGAHSLLLSLKVTLLGSFLSPVGVGVLSSSLSLTPMSSGWWEPTTKITCHLMERL